MKNVRISKALAVEVGNKVAEEMYKEKLEEAKKKLSLVADDLVRKYLPNPVIACIKEYRKYFQYCVRKCVNLCSDGYTQYCCTTNIDVPKDTFLNVEKHEFESYLALFKNFNRVCSERVKVAENISDALIGLKYYKRVEEEIPHLYKYLPVPEEEKHLPACNYGDLDYLVSCIKKSN